jgi:hypothetical protein
MIALHTIDTDRSAARRRHLASATAPSTMPIPSAPPAALDEVVSSDLSFEIDWFLAAVLMSTPAGTVDPATE